MAQMQNLIRRKGDAATWGGIPAPTPAINISADAATRGASRSPLTILPSVIAAPGLRSKVQGLRPGERKLLQALGDCLVVTCGALLILSHSEREYATASMIIS